MTASIRIPEQVQRELGYIKESIAKNHKTQWTHDCDECEFLGNVWEYNKVWDLYVHQGTRHEDNGVWQDITLIARYGSDGPDYSSGLSFIASSGVIALAFVRFLALRN